MSKKQPVVIIEEDRQTFITNRRTLGDLIKRKVLYSTQALAEMTGYGVKYIRKLCLDGKVNCERILGRYYFTPSQVAELRRPVRKKI